MTIGSTSMRARLTRASIVASAVALVAVSALVVAGTPAEASVSCPSVNPVTHAVVPAPGPGVLWSGCDLTGASMTGADLSGANLESADLTGADLSGSDLSGADLVGVTLAQADLTGCTVAGTNLYAATATGLKSGGLIGTPSAIPMGWVLFNGNLVGSHARLDGADLSGADLTAMDVRGISLVGANLSHTNFFWSVLNGADLTGATITGADLTASAMDGVKSGGLVGAPTSLTSGWALAKGYLVGPGVVLQSVDITGTDLSHVDLTDAVLDVDLTGVRSAGIFGSAPAFVRSPWTIRRGYIVGPGVNLSDASLTGVMLQATDLTGANLHGADFYGADLADAIITGTDLGGASLYGVLSGGTVGVPAALPAQWSLRDGYLLGPGATLSCRRVSIPPSGACTDLHGADLTGANLAGASLVGANLSGATLGVDLSGADLSGANLTGADLSGANLTGAQLPQADLTGATITGSTVTGADLGATLAQIVSGGVVGTPKVLPSGWTIAKGYLVGPHMNLSGIDLSDASLAGVDLTSTDLSGANLVGANLTGAEMASTTITGVDLTAAVLHGLMSHDVVGAPSALPEGWVVVQGHLVGPGVNLTLTDLSGLDLTGLDLSGADLSGANLVGATLSGVRLAGATLSGAHVGQLVGAPATLPTGWRIVNDYLAGPGALLAGADLSGQDMRGLDLRGAVLTGASLSSSDVTGGSLAGVDLTTMTLTGTTLVGVDLTGAGMAGMNMHGWNLHAANLSHAYLVGADLSSANLSGANLTGANLTSANLAGADLSDITCVDGTPSYLYLGGACNGIRDFARPVASPTFSPGVLPSRWSNADFTIAWNWSDAASGIDPTRCPPSTTVSVSSLTQGWTTVTGACADRAGNVAQAVVGVGVDTAAPAAPVVSRVNTFALGKVLGFSWTGSDALSGVAGAQWRWSRESVLVAAAPITWASSAWVTSPTTAGRVAVLPGNRYCVQVRVRDSAGNIGPWSSSRCASTPAGDRSLAASAGWVRGKGAGWSGGTYTATTRLGAALSTPRALRLRQVGVLATVCPACGTVAVYVGRTRLGVLSLRRSTTARSALVLLPRSTIVRLGVVRLVVTSAAKVVDIDGLAISRS